MENLHVKGMVRNHKLAKSISDVGWGMFVNFLAYKLERKQGELIEIDRFFPSSKKCSCCNHVMDELSLDIREWDCPGCSTHHDRDANAALNIGKQGIRILIANMSGGNPAPAGGGCVRPPARKSKGQRLLKPEAPTPLRVSGGSSQTIIGTDEVNFQRRLKQLDSTDNFKEL